MYILYDNLNNIKAISNKKIISDGLKPSYIDSSLKIEDLLNGVPIKNNSKPHSSIKVAFICNWKDHCGIATYSEQIVNSMRNKVKEITIFSEINNNKEEFGVIKCWKRGSDFSELITKVKNYNPDYIIIQHEYGIFPNAFHFMKIMKEFNDIPCAVVMHSIYSHLDKAVYSNCIENIIVHTNEAKQKIKEVGNTSNVFVIPHGCSIYSNTNELWNICLSQYTMLQFGFGFSYKGVDRALYAISHLKSINKKYENIQYIYLCSTNNHSRNSNSEYCSNLMKLAKDLNVDSNVVILQKYQTDEMINLYLRLAKLIIFPYIIDPSNEVFGASGAIRIAIANKRPIIASESHLFDDFEGIIPRPNNYILLANEIDKMFNDDNYKNSIINKSLEYAKNNTWDIAAEKYLSVFDYISSGYKTKNEY